MKDEYASALFNIPNLEKFVSGGIDDINRNTISEGCAFQIYYLLPMTLWREGLVSPKLAIKDRILLLRLSFRLILDEFNFNKMLETPSFLENN